MDYPAFDHCMKELCQTARAENAMEIAHKVCNAIQNTTPAQFKQEFKPLGGPPTRLTLAWNVAKALETTRKAVKPTEVENAIATIALALLRFPVPWSACTDNSLDSARENAVSALVRLVEARACVVSGLPSVVLASASWTTPGEYEPANSQVYTFLIPRILKQLKRGDRVKCSTQLMQCMVQVLQERAATIQNFVMATTILRCLRDVMHKLLPMSIVPVKVPPGSRVAYRPECALKAPPALKPEQLSAVQAVGREFLELFSVLLTSPREWTSLFRFDQAVRDFKLAGVFSEVDSARFVSELVGVLRAPMAHFSFSRKTAALKVVPHFLMEGVDIEALETAVRDVAVPQPHPGPRLRPAAVPIEDRDSDYDSEPDEEDFYLSPEGLILAQKSLTSNSKMVLGHIAAFKKQKAKARGTAKAKKDPKVNPKKRGKEATTGSKKKHKKA